MSHSYDDAASAWADVLGHARPDEDILAQIAAFARERQPRTPISFGTSGWRGEIGSDYTLHHVRLVTQAIVDMCREATPAVQAALGVPDFAAVQRQGVVVGHDNRFLGAAAAAQAIGVLKVAGIRTIYIGEAPTPEFATALDRLDAACSINLTPSHNPANYAGFKFNPKDGGPAGAEITSVITRLANARLERGDSLPATAAEADAVVDPKRLYEDFLRARGTLDLDRIRRFVQRPDVLVAVDHVHGSTRGRIVPLLGDSPNLRLLRTADNVLFGGIKPEPSPENMRPVTQVLRQSTADLKLGVIMDPDGDRVRFTDGQTEVPMNDFGAIAFHFLHVHKGIRGVLAKSVATSNFGNAIAAGLGVALKETPVGFKNFRPYLLPGADPEAVVAYEESDGITGFRHTLDKDALFGFLLALELMATTGMTLGDYRRQLEGEYGAFYPERDGIEVDRALAGPGLKAKIAALAERYRPGDRLAVGETSRAIAQVLTEDGVKLVLEDGSWLLVRPSGTEPKVRFYIETRRREEAQAMFATARELTRQALEG